MYVIYTHSEAFIETCSHRDKADIYLLYRNLLEKSLINMARIENRAPSLEKKRTDHECMVISKKNKLPCGKLLEF